MIAKARIDLSRWVKIRKELERAGRARVRVGMAEGPGRKLHKGTPLATILKLNEFGSGETPERAPIRRTFSNLDQRVIKVIGRWAGKVIEGKAKVPKALVAVGLSGRAAVRRKIRQRLDPPLAAGTIAAKRAKGERKRNPQPLINLAPLIDFEVVE